MIYAHVTAGVVDQVGYPPPLGSADGRAWDLRTLDVDALAACGWVTAVEAPRPADTSTQTTDPVWGLVGGSAVQTWTARAKTPAELAADAASTNEAAIRAAAADALAANRTFLAVASPTNAQIVAQVRALTRQNNALIRLTLRQFSGTD